MDLSNTNFSNLVAINSTAYPELNQSYFEMTAARNSKNSRQYYLLLEMAAESTLLLYPVGYFVANEYLNLLFGKSTESLVHASFVAEKMRQLLEHDKQDLLYAFGDSYCDVGSQQVNEMISDSAHNKTANVSALLENISKSYLSVGAPIQSLNMPKTQVQDAFNLLCGNSNSLIIDLNNLRNENIKTFENANKTYYMRLFYVEQKLFDVNSTLKQLYSDKINVISQEILENFNPEDTYWVPKTLLGGSSPKEILPNAEAELRMVLNEIEISKKIMSVKPKNYFADALAITSSLNSNLSAIEDELNQMKSKITLKEAEIIYYLSEKRNFTISKFRSLKNPSFTISNWFLKQMEIAEQIMNESKSKKTGERFEAYAQTAQIYAITASAISSDDPVPELQENAEMALKSLNRTIFLAELDGLNVDYEKSQLFAMQLFLERSDIEDIFALTMIPENCRLIKQGIYQSASIAFDYLNQLRLEYMPVFELLNIYSHEQIYEDYLAMNEFEQFVVDEQYSPEHALGSFKSIAKFYESIENKTDEIIFSAINQSIQNSLTFEYSFSSVVLNEENAFTILLTAENKLPLSTRRQIILSPNVSGCGQIVLDGVSAEQSVYMPVECYTKISELISENVSLLSANSEIAYLRREIEFKINFPDVRVQFPKHASAMAKIDGTPTVFDGFVEDLNIGIHKLTLDYYISSPVAITINYMNASGAISAAVICQNNLDISLPLFEFDVLLDNFSQMAYTPSECNKTFGSQFHCRLQFLPYQVYKLNFGYSPANVTPVLVSLLNATIIYTPSKNVSTQNYLTNITGTNVSIPSSPNSTQSQKLKEIVQLQKLLDSRANSILSLPLDTNLTSAKLYNLSYYLDMARDALADGNMSEFEIWAQMAIDESKILDLEIGLAENYSLSQIYSYFDRFDVLKSNLNTIFKAYALAFTVNGTLKGSSISSTVSKLSSCSVTVEEARANVRTNSFAKVKQAIACIEKLESDLGILNETIAREQSSASIMLSMANESVVKSGSAELADMLKSAKSYFDNGEYAMTKEIAVNIIKNASKFLPVTYSSVEAPDVSEKKNDSTIIFIVFIIIFVLLFSIASLKKEKKELPWVVKRVRHST